MTFDYKKQTRDHYKSAAVANAYHAEFTSLRGLNGFRFRLITRRERTVTRQLLRLIGPRTVLDIPAGTGKMAPVYKELGIKVIAADISNEMLEVSRRVYTDLQYENVHFVQCEAESAANLASDYRFDAVVCVRLMHRVPAAIRRTMLEQFARTARHLIVSYGIDSPFHRVRRSVRRALIGGLDVSVSQYVTMHRATTEIGEFFHIADCLAVLPGFSNEYLFVATSR